MKGYALVSIVLIMVIQIMSGCSGVQPPVLPSGSSQITQSIPDMDSNRQIFGIWEIEITSTGATVTDVTERELAAHYNVKAFLKPPKCSDCLKFSNITDDPVNHILSADVTIKNPTLLWAADLRGIAISKNPEIYLANPEDYTDFYDLEVPPAINPFRLFKEGLMFGNIGPGGTVTEHFKMHYDSIPFIFRTAVDAIYPIDSSREPYAIQNQSIDGDLDDQGKVTRHFRVNVLDRNNNTGEVRLISDQLGINLLLTKDATDPTLYKTDITNTLLKPAGNYKCLISAGDSVKPWILYDYFTITVVPGSTGGWVIDKFNFDTGSCSKDIGLGFDNIMSEAVALFPGGASCNNISKTNFSFGSATSYLSLIGIDPLNGSFSPYPVKRIDVSTSGGLGFFSSSDSIYNDGFYSGPVKSLLITVFPDVNNQPKYINKGDGDSSRMYPSNNQLTGVDVTDDTMGNLYGLWADPAGVLPQEFYGLSPDFTRHDVFMGGIFPSNLIGNTPGTVSANASELRGIDVANFTFQNGDLLITEAYGISREIEVVQFSIDFMTFTTFFNSKKTIPLGVDNAIDLDVLPMNPNYILNPSAETLAVLINTGSNGIIKLYNAFDYSFLENIGTVSNPVIQGTPMCIDVSLFDNSIIVQNNSGSVARIKWVS